MFCIRIIIEPYHFVMLLEAEDTGLQFCLILSWPLLSQFWLATITTSQLLFTLLFVIWNTVIHPEFITAFHLDLDCFLLLNLNSDV